MNITFNSLPVDAPLRITSPFGPRNTGIPGASTYHKGVDLGRDFAKPKTVILAVKDGVVSSNYYNAYRGWVATIQHDNTYTTLYQHLAGQCPLAVGARVKAGQPIGVMGNSCDPDKLKAAVHLHFELRKNGSPIDPEPYLRNIKKEVEEMTEAEVRKIIREELAGAGKPVSDWAAPYWAARTADGHRQQMAAGHLRRCGRRAGRSCDAPHARLPGAGLHNRGSRRDCVRPGRHRH